MKQWSMENQYYLKYWTHVRRFVQIFIIHASIVYVELSCALNVQKMQKKKSQMEIGVSGWLAIRNSTDRLTIDNLKKKWPTNI